MNSYAYRIVNVFAEAPLEGNPLCVFEDGRGLDDATMQALALQFNLSETTFILPSQSATAHVRIFTPTFEMPFAGHPTLGTAHVVRSLRNSGNAMTLELRASIIPVQAEGDVWTLEANPPKHRTPTAARVDLAAMLGLNVGDLADALRLFSQLIHRRYGVFGNAGDRAHALERLLGGRDTSLRRARNDIGGRLGAPRMSGHRECAIGDARRRVDRGVDALRLHGRGLRDGVSRPGDLIGRRGHLLRAGGELFGCGGDFGCSRFDLE